MPLSTRLGSKAGSWGAVLFLLGWACLGCPAQAAPPEDASTPDDAGAPDSPVDVAMQQDAAPDDAARDASCAPASKELRCDDGCDDDGDGFIDRKDPDCVTAFLITREPPDGILVFRVGESQPETLHAGGVVTRPIVHAAHLRGGFAVQRGMAPGRGVYRFDPRPDPAPAAEFLFDTGYQPADVCVIGGRVVVAELGAPRVHLYVPEAADPDAGVVSPIRSVTLSRGTAARACAADDTWLYVVVATASGTDDIARLDAELGEIDWPGLPSGLPAEKRRLLDLAWDGATGRFYGLFVGAEPNAEAVTPFQVGGAAEDPVSAPFALTTLSTFAP